MKKLGAIILVLFMILISGCASKYEGTWCKYSDVATTLVILEEDISENDFNNITQYIKTISDLRSFDVIDKIEEASKMITIYYKNEDNILTYENILKGYKGIKRLESSKMNIVVDQLVLKKDNYVYDKSLNSIDAYEYTGKYSREEDIIKLDNNINFYYKDKFLCYDKDCNNILTKSKKNECNS